MKPPSVIFQRKNNEPFHALYSFGKYPFSGSSGASGGSGGSGASGASGVSGVYGISGVTGVFGISEILEYLEFLIFLVLPSVPDVIYVLAHQNCPSKITYCRMSEKKYCVHNSVTEIQQGSY